MYPDPYLSLDGELNSESLLLQILENWLEISDAAELKQLTICGKCKVWWSIGVDVCRTSTLSTNCGLWVLYNISVDLCSSAIQPRNDKMLSELHGSPDAFSCVVFWLGTTVAQLMVAIIGLLLALHLGDWRLHVSFKWAQALIEEKSPIEWNCCMDELNQSTDDAKNIIHTEKIQIMLHTVEHFLHCSGKWCWHTCIINAKSLRFLNSITGKPLHRSQVMRYRSVATSSWLCAFCSCRCRHSKQQNRLLHTAHLTYNTRVSVRMIKGIFCELNITKCTGILCIFFDRYIIGNTQHFDNWYSHESKLSLTQLFYSYHTEYNKEYLSHNGTRRKLIWFATATISSSLWWDDDDK